MMGAWLVAPPPLVNDNTVAVGGTPDSDQAGRPGRWVACGNLAEEALFELTAHIPVLLTVGPRMPRIASGTQVGA